MQVPSSITHLHLLSVVHTELACGRYNNPVRILDIGCGSGALLSYLQQELSELLPSLRFELYGLDVVDHGVQENGFIDDARETLMSQYPQVDWNSRLVAISLLDSWPYQDGYFDVILSNQVVEHIGDHDRFCAQIRRTLRQGGWSVHLFPLKECLYEGHLYLPLAHRIQNHDFRVAWIRALSRVGLGKFRIHRREKGVTVEAYVERHADYIQHYTNYISYSEMLTIAKRNSLRGSFRYTQEFYVQKLRSLLKLKPRYQYRKDRSPWRDWLATLLLKRISSVTLFLEKRESYRGT